MLNGRAGAGKDTFADYLVEKYNFKKISFAFPIYEIAQKYFSMEQKDRWLLQQIGQKMREIRSSVWVDYAFKEANKYDKVVISDLRQFNEGRRGLEEGYILIRINTDLDKRIERLYKRDGIYPSLDLLENESETGADIFDYIEINNNGTKEELYTQIDELIKKLFD